MGIVLEDLPQGVKWRRSGSPSLYPEPVNGLQRLVPPEFYSRGALEKSGRPSNGKENQAMMEQIVSFEKEAGTPGSGIYAASVKVPDRYRFVQESNCIANFPLKENPTSMSDYPYISMVGRQPLEGAFSVVTDCL